MSETLRFISAGAGSGKTHRLTTLLHEMLLDHRTRPSGILATTFTNKAAAELRERVRSHLIEKGQFARATEIGQARIGTVNSVCGDLLKRFAFAAGMPTEQRVLDESRAALILDEAIEEIIEGPALSELLQVAQRLGLRDPGYGQEGSPWKAALTAIVSQARSNALNGNALKELGQRNANQLLSFFPTPTEQDLDRELACAIDDGLPAVRQIVDEGGKKNAATYLNLLEEARRDLDRREMTWGQWNRVASLDSGVPLRPIVQAIKDIAAQHARHPRLHQDLRDYLSTIFSIAADVLETYRARKRQLGAVDFTDQECELLEILALPTVAETLRAELDLLMVDEFQDTSPIQLALFVKLAEYARHVVWVGDIKQAIYGFRGGDAALMTAVLGGLKDLGGEKEVLPYSYRSRPALVSFVNSLFGAAFAGVPATDVHLHPKREEHQDAFAVEDWHLEGKRLEDQRHAIASGVFTLLNSGTRVMDKGRNVLRALRLSDIAVLARSNNTVNEIAGVLQFRGIRASTEQPGLLRRPEVILALACLRRLNDERDTIATAEIVSLSECQEPEVWLTERLAWLDHGKALSGWQEDEDAKPIFSAIRNLRAQRALLSPQEAVRLLIARCELTRRVLQWQQSPERARLRLANLERLAGLATEYEDECRSTRDAASLSGFLLWLKDLASDEADTMPQPAVDAVQVMTHHAAKGLEWPVVILVDLTGDVKESTWNQVRAESVGVFNVREPLANRALRYWPWPYGSQSKVPVSEDVENSEVGLALRAAAIEEHRRLLYVSMTRARDLVVLARPAGKSDGEWMATIGLAGRLPVSDSDPIQLADGSSVPFLRRHLGADSAELAVAPPLSNLNWFMNPTDLTERLSLKASPSQASSVVARVSQTTTIGSRIAVKSGVDAADLGEAVHACLAAYLSSESEEFGTSDVADILDRMGVPGALPAEELLGQLIAVRGWISTRWPSATMMIEVPITRLLGTRQILLGRIDLLLRTAEGWILLDHKSGSQNSTQWESLATTYGGQLAAYSEAIEKVTGVAVKEAWLVLPVAGVGLRVEE